MPEAEADVDSNVFLVHWVLHSLWIGLAISLCVCLCVCVCVRVRVCVCVCLFARSPEHLHVRPSQFGCFDSDSGLPPSRS